MKEKTVIPIKDIIFTKENIVELAKCLYNKDEKNQMLFNIKFMNGQEIQSDNISIFENKKFNEYEIKTIQMLLNNSFHQKYVHVFIYNYDNNESTSSIEIAYENEENYEWFASTEKKIKEQLSYCSKRNKIVIFLRNNWIYHCTVIILSCFEYFFLHSLISRFIDLNKEIYIYVGLINSLLLLIMNYVGTSLFNKAFPRVEIDIDEKNNRAMKIRKGLKRLISILMCSNIISIAVKIFELVK